MALLDPLVEPLVLQCLSQNLLECIGPATTIIHQLQIKLSSNLQQFLASIRLKLILWLAA